MPDYTDLMRIANSLVTFLLVLGVNCYCGFSPGYLRAGAGAALEWAYAAASRLPVFAFLGNPLWRAICLILVCLVCFGMEWASVRRGALFCLLKIGMETLALAFCENRLGRALLWTGMGWLLCRFRFPGGRISPEYVPVELNWQGRRLNLLALRDTGNLLRDPITGEQVFVAGADVGKELLGLGEEQFSRPVEALASGAFPGMRLIPYCAVGQPGGMMLCMRFRDSKVGNSRRDILVAFAPNVLAGGKVYRMLTGGAESW